MVRNMVDQMIGSIFGFTKQGGQVLLRQGIDHAGALALHRHQAAVLEQAQLVRYGRTGYARQDGQIADAQGLLHQCNNDARPGGVGQGGKDIHQDLQMVSVWHPGLNR